MTDKLTPEQHRIALTVLLEKVKTVPLTGFDDETIGDKDSQVSWGLCNREADRWPPDTRIWPNCELGYRSMYKDGIIVEVPMVYSIKDHLGCPLDKRQDKSPWGCFYHCRFFQGPKPTREQAIELINLEIRKYENSKD